MNVALARRGARTVRIAAPAKKLRIEAVGDSFVPHLERTVAHMFRLYARDIDPNFPQFAGSFRVRLTAWR